MKIAVYNRSKKWLTVYNDHGERLSRHYRAVQVSVGKSFTEVSFLRPGEVDRTVICECILIREYDEE